VFRIGQAKQEGATQSFVRFVALLSKGSAVAVMKQRRTWLAGQALPRADHAWISSILRGFFEDAKVIDGAHREYTDVNVTGDHTGTIWSLPELPSHRSIEDIADSILAC
jgi:hypothetical protein